MPLQGENPVRCLAISIVHIYFGNSAGFVLTLVLNPYAKDGVSNSTH